jgi:hypothetical protein
MPDNHPSTNRPPVDLRDDAREQYEHGVLVTGVRSAEMMAEIPKKCFLNSEICLPSLLWELVLKRCRFRLGCEQLAKNAAHLERVLSSDRLHGDSR